jgi:hypothetical protein
MLTLVCLLILAIMIAATWFLGAWNNFLNWVSVLLAGLVATSFYEPVADLLDASYFSYTYMLDFFSLWGLFFLTFGVLRLGTDLLSRYRLKLHAATEIIGRSLFSVWTAWVFLCFALFTLHTAPLPADAFGGSFQPTPDSRNFVVGPDRLWLALVHSRSRGALSESISSPWFSEYDLPTHPDDEGLNVCVFDPQGDFLYKYYARRAEISQLPALRVTR